MEYTDLEKGLQDIKTAGAAVVKEASDVVEAFQNKDYIGMLSEAGDFGVQLAATGGVVVISAAGGILKIGEYIDDGITLIDTGVGAILRSTVDFIAGTDLTDPYLKRKMDEIAEDRVGKVIDAIYANTGIDEKSFLKEDGANLVYNLFEKAGEVGLITAATIASGGTAAPLLGAIGYLKGSGEEAERRFNLKDENGNYTNRNIIDFAMSGFSGLTEGLEWFGLSQSIGSMSQAISYAKQVGFDGLWNLVSTSLSKLTPQMALESATKGALGAFLDKDTWFDVGTGILDFVMDGVNTGNWDWGSLITDTVINLGSNIIGGATMGILGETFYHYDPTNQSYGLYDIDQGLIGGDKYSYNRRFGEDSTIILLKQKNIVY